MHRSKLAGIIIDCRTEDLDGAARLLDPQDRLHSEVQRVSHPSRVRSWCVMEAPTGQRFCVVRAASREFSRSANEWPAG